MEKQDYFISTLPHEEKFVPGAVISVWRLEVKDEVAMNLYLYADLERP